MFCTSCGKEIPDGSTVCDLCGKQIVSVANPTTEQGGAKSSTDVNVGAYIKDFFSDPVSAVLSRSKDSYMVWGLIIAAIYPVVLFLKYVLDDSIFNFEFSTSFGLFFAVICGIAALIFALFLFQGLFKVEKRSLQTIVAAVGLSFTPMFALYIVGLIMDTLFAGDTYAFFAFTANAFISAGYVFSAIVLSKFFDADQDRNRSKSTILVVLSFVCALFIQAIVTIIVYKSI
jgi:hypothetical protein